MLWVRRALQVTVIETARRALSQRVRLGSSATFLNPLLHLFGPRDSCELSVGLSALIVRKGSVGRGPFVVVGIRTRAGAARQLRPCRPESKPSAGSNERHESRSRPSCGPCDRIQCSEGSVIVVSGGSSGRSRITRHEDMRMSAKKVGRIASGPASMTDQILEQIPTPVMAVDRKLKITYMNAADRRFLGKSWLRSKSSRSGRRSAL